MVGSPANETAGSVSHRHLYSAGVTHDQLQKVRRIPRIQSATVVVAQVAAWLEVNASRTSRASIVATWSPAVRQRTSLPLGRSALRATGLQPVPFCYPECCAWKRCAAYGRLGLARCPAPDTLIQPQTPPAI